MPIDYSKYPPNWKTEIVPAIKDRDGHRCKFCGVDNYAVLCDGTPTDGNGPHMAAGQGRHWPSMDHWAFSDAREFADGMKDIDEESRWTVVVLTIAHLDHHTQNNDYANLAALCQRCHNAYDSEYRRANAAATRRRKRAIREPLLIDVEGNDNG